MRTCYFDCFSGAAGDMIVAALLDAGASLDNLKAQLGTLAVSSFGISAVKVNKQGFAATAFEVKYDDNQPHRHLGDVLQIIRGGKLSDRVVQESSNIFRRLADAEASVHGTTVEQVHFHEVGAIDAIVDVVGACLALEDLAVEQILCSEIPTGSGTVTCAHGVMPIPAPATAELLKNVPLASCDEKGELITPTGAAILTTLAKTFAPLSGLSIERIGYGAGRREGRSRPNLLRVFIGDSSADTTSDTIAVLQANIDDQSPELLAHATQRLLEQGAVDAFSQPVHMKKGRCGFLLTVLCAPEKIAEMESLIFRETTTFGIRRQLMQRSTLERRHETVALAEGSVRIKIGSRDGLDLTASPEFEDCRRLAEQAGLSAKDVMSEAMALWRQKSRSGDRVEL